MNTITFEEHVVATYRGVDVLLYGKQRRFIATINKARVSAGTYLALTEKLDEELGFEPFYCYRIVHQHGTGGRVVEKIRIEGIDKTSSNGKRYWITEDDHRRPLDQWAELFSCMPEVQKMLTEYLKREQNRKAAEERLKEERAKDQEELRAMKLPRANGDDT